MTLNVDELIQRGALDALADVFGQDAAAHELLSRIDFPLGRRPGETKNAIFFWRQACSEIAHGLTSGGLERLLTEAAELFPHNLVLGPWKLPSADAPSAFGSLLGELEPEAAEVDLAADAIRGFYRRCSPPDWPPLPPTDDSAHLLRSAVLRLGQALRQKNDAVPLLQFVHLLTDVTRDNRQAALKSWLKRATRSFAADPDDEEALRSALEIPEPEKEDLYFLLVQVEPRTRSRDAFIVKAWLNGPGELACLRPGEERSRSEFPGILSELRQDVAERGIAPEQMWVELMLPRELLCADVDQWQVALDLLDAPIPIGIDHPIVVRSLERAQVPTAVRSLERRWKTLQARGDQRCQVADVVGTGTIGEDHAVVCLGRQCLGGTRLYTQLRQAAHVVCALLDQPPDPDPDREDVLNALLQTGIGVMLWERPATDGIGGHRLKELARDSLLQLPQRVWNHRVQAAASESCDESALTLLWDDPTRPFPDFDRRHRFTAPAKRRT